MGEEAKSNFVLKEILEKHIGDITHALESNTLNVLAWMIADDILEFKFAVAREEYSGGDYHDKVAVFRDNDGDIVAIHGSFNDSIKGSLNGEAFSVFKSWDSGHRPYVEQHLNRLNQLFDDKNRQFKVYTIPEAIREKFIKLRTTEKRPYQTPSNPSSAVREFERCNINRLRLKSGHFLHYIFY